MSGKPLTIIYEDNHLLAVSKPAGPPTQGAAEGVVSVLDMAKDYLRQRYDKPGNVYLGVVSRLDAPVTGLLLFARTSKAAGRLSEAFRTRKVEKRYLVTVAGDAPDPQGRVVHHLMKDDRNHRMFATHAEAPAAQRAELSYEVLHRAGDRSLLAVNLHTGRKHQIRVQLSKLGYPILGDEKYGSTDLYRPGIALHSWRLLIEHPVRKVPLSLACEPAPGWGRWHVEELRELMRTP